MDFAEVHELTVEKSKSLQKTHSNEPNEATPQQIKSFFGV